MIPLVAVEEPAAIVVAVAAGLAALGYLGRWVRNLVHSIDRLDSLMRPTARTVKKELTTNHGSSMKDTVDDLQRRASTNAAGIETLRGLLLLLADDIVRRNHHGRQTMRIVRESLAEQGIDLPVVPGESLDDLDLDRFYLPTHREEPPHDGT